MLDFINRNIPTILAPTKDVVVKTVSSIPGWFGIALAFVSFRLGMLWEAANDKLDGKTYIDLSDLDDSIEKLEHDIRFVEDKDKEDDVSSIGSRDPRSDDGGGGIACVGDLVTFDDDNVSVGSRELRDPPPPPPASPMKHDLSQNLVSNMFEPPPTGFDFSKIAAALTGK